MSLNTPPRALVLGLPLLLACSCSGEPTNVSTTAAPAPQKETLPSPAGATASTLTSAEAAGGLAWEGRAPLVRCTPKSSMRAAEYGLEGEPKAELGVFYFGPDQGGSVEANLTRWLGQFSQPDGSDTSSKARREQLTFGGVQVTTVEVTGTYSGGMAMPGAPAPSAISDAMLLGAIASGPKGPVFFKLVGPRTAVDRERDAFRKLLESLHVDPSLSP